MTAVLVKAVSLVAIVAVGYGIKKVGWVKPDAFHVLAIVVLRFTLPCALITSFNAVTITGSLLWIVLVGFSVNLIQQGYGWWRARRLSQDERAFAILHSGSYNVGAFAMPYSAQLVGPVAVVHAAMFDIGSSVASGGIGYGWGLAIARGKRPTLLGFLAQMVKSPVFDTYLVLFILRLVRFSFPAPIISFTSLVGGANPVVAMLMIGVGLELSLPKATWLKAVKYLVRRYVFVLAFCAVVWFVLPTAIFDRQIKVVIMMVLWAPIAAMIAGFVDEAGSDVELSALLTSVTIIIGIVMMPAVYLVLG